MKILITGGNGFMGNHLFKHLCSKHNVSIPTSKELDLTQEKKVSDYLKCNNFDVIVHAANHDGVTKYTIKNRNDILDKNLRMFFNLSKNHHLFGRMISLGTGAEYGKEFCTGSMSEDNFDINIPSDSYGFSKYIMSKYAQTATHDIIILRFFGVYGMYEDWRIRFISNACCRNICKLPIYIHQNRLMDYIHINDACNIIELFLNINNTYNIYNVCSGHSIELTQIASIIKNNYNKIDEKILKKGMGNPYFGNNSRLLSEFGNDLKFISIEKGISEMYKWYLDHPNIYDKNFLKSQNIEVS